MIRVFTLLIIFFVFSCQSLDNNDDINSYKPSQVFYANIPKLMEDEDSLGFYFYNFKALRQDSNFSIKSFASDILEKIEIKDFSNIDYLLVVNIDGGYFGVAEFSQKINEDKISNLTSFRILPKNNILWFSDIKGYLDTQKQLSPSVELRYIVEKSIIDDKKIIGSFFVKNFDETDQDNILSKFMDNKEIFKDMDKKNNVLYPLSSVSISSVFINQDKVSYDIIQNFNYKDTNELDFLEENIKKFADSLNLDNDYEISTDMKSIMFKFKNMKYDFFDKFKNLFISSFVK